MSQTPSRIQFYYNNTFFPEYISVILISLFVWPYAFWVLNRQAPPVAPDPSLVLHVVLSVFLYVAIALFLIWLTIKPRQQYESVCLLSFSPTDFQQMNGHDPHLIINGYQEPLSDIVKLKEDLGSHYGRAVRRLKIFFRQGQEADCHDGLFQYELLRRSLEETTRLPIQQAEKLTPERVENISYHWARRHLLFPEKAGCFRIILRLFCLLPVFGFDLAINLMATQWMAAGNRLVMMAYISPLTLIFSAFVARFVYYYLFTHFPARAVKGVPL